MLDLLLASMGGAFLFSVCLAGLIAIGAAWLGASTALSLALGVIVLVCGVVFQLRVGQID
jgi:hypothetical protein